MEITEANYLAHYGTLRKSGRYPWGSGGGVEQSQTFLGMIDNLISRGIPEKEVAQAMGLRSTAELRDERTIATAEIKASKIAQIVRLKGKGMSPTAIGRQMGMPEPTVRSYLKPYALEAANRIKVLSDMLRRQVDEKGVIDIGNGTENALNASKEHLRTAAHLLRTEGYNVYTNLPVPQLGTNYNTNRKVLAKENITWSEVRRNPDLIRTIDEHMNETGRGTLGIIPPLAINPKRLDVVYGPDGAARDGVVYVRPGVKDVSLGGSQYAQVRIQVGKDHYIKGMAIYKDDLPDGVDLQFHSNKKDTGQKLDALKPLQKETPANMFGTVIKRQITESRPDGTDKVTSAVNLVREEGDWQKWSKTIASQVLSKQSTTLAREQLKLTTEWRKNEFDEIMRLTNPTVKRKLLEEYALSVDAASVHLKAANLPRQQWQVVLPISSLKVNEVYAPNFKQGEHVALIRYPHGGTFEIPILVVNNNNREAKGLLKRAKDAVGINHEVAERLSGADFDGDTVLVIPNNNGKIKSTPALEGLKGFNPQVMYKGYPGMKVMSNTQIQMGVISNLIADMNIQKASQEHMAQAVRHSMVVIDAEKKELNYRESARANNISALKQRYQPKNSDGQGGAATLISRAGRDKRVPDFKPRTEKNGGPIDKLTGELRYEPTNNTNYSTGKLTLKKVTELEWTTDANSISSGTPIERLYADHSNRLKAMANKARLEAINTPRATHNRAAKKVYAAEVASLTAQLKLAQSNAPLERRAQSIAGAKVKAIKESMPDLDSRQEKKLGYQALDEARARVGAKKTPVTFTPREWEAIQAGAISDTHLQTLLRNAEPDKVRALAQPRVALLMTSSKIARAKALLGDDRTRAEVAQILGVSLTTLDEAIGG